MVLEITDSNFEELVLKSEKPIVLDFWAQWCGPCKMISPIVDELSEEYNGQVAFGKVDCDNNNGITAKFRIRNIPTLLFFKNGEIVDKHVGVIAKSALAAKLEGIL